MPSPKSGNAPSAVAPSEPKKAEEADKADPGEMTQVKARQVEAQTGKYGSPQTTPHKPPKTQEEKEKKKSWIEIELVNEKNKPISGKRYKITLPDGETVAEGTLDEKGCARVDGIDPGTCKVTFPQFDENAWAEA